MDVKRVCVPHLYLYIYLCKSVYMCVCVSMYACVNDREGTFLSCLCWRRLVGFGAPSAWCFLVCSHPIVWNPKSKDFWEQKTLTLNVVRPAFVSVYLDL